MNVSGLELVAQHKIDTNRELKIAGAINLILGLSGGILSFQSLSKSVLSHKIGKPGRLTTLIDAGVFMIVPLFGISHLAYFPKAILGGLLLFLGLSLLIKWVYVAWSKLSKFDYSVVQLIWIVSSTIGFLQGVTLGWLLVVLCVMFRSKRFFCFH